MADEELDEETETHTDEEGEVTDPEEGSEDPRADEEEVPPVDDEGERPDVDWDEDAPDIPSGEEPDNTPPVEPDPVPETRYKTVTRKTVEAIHDFSAEILQAYQDSGAKAYAVYDDGTRVEVPWSEVSDPSPAGVEVAYEAGAVALATNQHFWQNSEQPETHGGAGVHVTDETQEEWKQAVADGFPDLSDSKPHHNVLINSLGILLRSALRNLVSITRSAIAFFDGQGNDSSNIVAFFGKDGAQIGRKGNAHVEMDFNSFKMFDKDGVDFFVADDLRDETGVATITETFRGDGSTRFFMLAYSWTEIVSVTDSSHDGATYTVIEQLNTILFDVAPSDGANVTFVYKTSSNGVKTYTFGMRKAGSVSGPMSVAEGDDVEASGYTSHTEGHSNIASGNSSHAEGQHTTANDTASHAEGYYTTARRSYSHAEGDNTTANGAASHAEGYHTTASTHAQHVEGKYNIEDTSGQYAHIIGNGTDANHRSNALTVDWDGNVECGNLNGVNMHADSQGNPITRADYGSVLYLLSKSIDRTKADNGVSNTIYPGVSLQDKAGRISARWESPTYPNGDAAFFFYVRQYDEDGQLKHQEGLRYNLTREGVGTWSVAQPKDFRRAIGLGSTTQNLTLSNATGKMTLVHNETTVSLFVRGVKITNGLANNTTVTIGTIPSGYRPQFDIFEPIYQGSKPFNGDMRVGIETSGAVTVRNVSGSTFPATSTFGKMITYVI